MTVRAVAAPSDVSNAVGSIELECTPEGLHMRYLSVGAFRRDYAPAALTSGTQCLAPWPQVEEVERRGGRVRLVIDAKLTPHNQLLLTNFEAGSPLSKTELGRRRWFLRAAIGALATVVALTVYHWLPQWSASSTQVAAALVGFGGAGLLMALSLFLERYWLVTGPPEQEVLEGFLADIARLRPAPISDFVRPPEKPLDLVDVLRAIPRSTTALVILLSASCLAAVLTSNWIIRGPGLARTEVEPRNSPPPETPPPPPAPAAVQPPPPPASTPTGALATTSPAPPAVAAPSGDSCKCERPDSPLWRTSFPQLSTLLISRHLRPHKNHRHLELELAVINNGRERLKEVSLTVHFFEGKGRQPTKDRPLYYEASLRPGQAIKWHVEARGDSFSVDNAKARPLEEKQLASADDFAKLLEANHRPVRLHGAMMLAYLRDDRAKAGALALQEALREEEAPFLGRVVESLRDVYPCTLRAPAAGRHRRTEVCLFNGSSAVAQDLELTLRGLDRPFDHRNPVAAPPVVVAEKQFRLPAPLPPQEGRWLFFDFDTDNPSGTPTRALELLVAPP